MDSPDYAPDDFKCATFDPALRAKITPEIRAKMDADRAKARAEMAERRKDSEPPADPFYNR